MESDLSVIRRILPEINRVVSKTLGTRVSFQAEGSSGYRGQYVNLSTGKMKQNLGVFRHIIESYWITVAMHDLRMDPDRMSGQHPYDFNGLIEFYYDHVGSGSNGHNTNLVLTISGDRVGIVKR